MTVIRRSWMQFFWVSIVSKKNLLSIPSSHLNTYLHCSLTILTTIDRKQIVKQLIEKANVNATDRSGKTALHKASGYGNPFYSNFVFFYNWIEYISLHNSIPKNTFNFRELNSYLRSFEIFNLISTFFYSRQ